MNSIILSYVLMIYMSVKIIVKPQINSGIRDTRLRLPNNNHNIQQHPERHSEKTEEERTMDPLLRYDPKADILVIKLEEGETVDEKLLDSDILLGLGRDGRIVSLEVWDASKRGSSKPLPAWPEKKGT